MKPVALLTERRYAATRAPPGDWYLGNILEEDRLLAAGLAARGFGAERIDWSEPGVDWSRFAGAVFRTTWDYFERIDELLVWLDLAGAQTRLLNPAELIRWNLDKRYLLDLERAGVSVVPTRVVGRGSSATLADLVTSAGWSEVVVKPAVSACASRTFRSAESGAFEERWRRLVGERDMLVQAFQPAILETGEVTVVVIDGKVTHAVRKTAAPGDFRVQDDHGGVVHNHVPEPDEIALAEAAMAACDPAPVYGRVDMVRDTNGGPRVMELELIEPELWLRVHPPAADRLAAAITAAISRARAT